VRAALHEEPEYLAPGQRCTGIFKSEK
jgi:hypothetical protein